MSLKKNISATFTGQIISTLANFLNSILIARLLGVSSLGDFAIYTNSVNLSLLFLGFGIPVSVIYFISSSKISKDKILNFMLLMIFSNVILVGVILLLLNCTGFLSIMLPVAKLNHVIWIFIINFFLQFTINLCIAFLNGEKKFVTSTLLFLIYPLLCLLFNSIYYFYFNNFYDNFEAVIFLSILSFLVQFIIVVSYFSFGIKVNYKISFLTKMELKHLLSFSILIYVGNLLQFLNYKMDIWFLNYYSTKQETSLYVLAVNLSQLLWILPGAIHTVLFSHISHIKDNFLPIIKNIFTVVFIYCIIFGILGYIIAYYLVPIIYGDEFALSVSMMGILLLGIIPIGCSLVISAYFAGTKQFKYCVYGALFSLIFCTFFNFLLIPKYGAKGAAFSSVISYIINTSYLFYIFAKKNSVKFTELFIINKKLLRSLYDNKTNTP